MKRFISVAAGLSAGLLYAGALCAGQLYYVQSAKAKILSGPSFKSAVVAEAVMGQGLDSIGKEGSWIKVRSEGKEGYVSSLLLSHHQPFGRKVFIQGDDAEIKQGVRRRASSFTSAAAARGLTKDDRKRSDVEDGVNFAAVKEMESVKISDEEVTRFVEGGGL